MREEIMDKALSIIKTAAENEKNGNCRVYKGAL